MTVPDHDHVVVIGTLCKSDKNFKKNRLHEEGTTYDTEVVITLQHIVSRSYIYIYVHLASYHIHAWYVLCGV